MEGRTSTFDKVLADFESRLARAEFVAIDTELTGVDIEGEIDHYDESAAVRLERICRVAERYTLIQIGLTVVGRIKNGHEETLSCASYNFYASPGGGECKELSRDPVFMSQSSALSFNSKHRLDFNTWISQGIPYMTREDERRLKATGAFSSEELDQKTGLLRLWKALCAARIPFVVHCPLDLFFLLVAFEKRPLPRGDPRALAILIRQCTPKVYDTAHLHGAIGRFRRLGLSKFFEDAKVRHDELVKNSSSGVMPVEFVLQGETAVRYSKTAEQMAHEAGYDSLMTAQLYGYLRAISPIRIKEAANRLFLYRSIEFVDIDRAATEGVVGCSMFDLSRVTLLVARLDPSDTQFGIEAPRLLAAAGAEYKWMDTAHILVVLRASGGAAIRKARDLASQVHGVEAWLPFEEWRDKQVAEAEASKVKENGISTVKENGMKQCHGASTREEAAAVTNGHAGSATGSGRTSAAEASVSAPRNPSASSSPTASSTPDKSSAIIGTGARDVEGQRWSLFLRAIGVSGVIALLALLRLRRRLRPR